MLVGPFKEITATPENIEQSMKFIAGYIKVCRCSERTEKYKIILFDLETERVKLIDKIKKEEHREEVVDKLLAKYLI